MTAGLTKRQAQVLSFVKRYVPAHGGVAPSLDDIRNELGLRAKSGVHRMVEALIKRGLLSNIKGTHRSLSVLDPAAAFSVSGVYLTLVAELASAANVGTRDVIELAVLEYAINHPLQGETKMNAFTERTLTDGHYPTTPGYKTDGTSKEAAEAASGGAPRLRAEALGHVVDRPSTADEIAAALRKSVLAVRPRVTELKKFAMIAEHRDDAGKKVRRQNESGCWATVWEATERGRAALAAGTIA
jgi:hypothetical protein